MPHARDERGSAALEFATAGLLLLVPLVFLVLAVSAVQAAALGVEGAARQASRVYVQAGSLAEARAAAGRAIEVALADYGLEATAAQVSVSCSPDPAHCLRPRGFVTVRIDTSVALPVAPPVLGLELAPRIPVSSTATEQVSRFAGER